MPVTWDVKKCDICQKIIRHIFGIEKPYFDFVEGFAVHLIFSTKQPFI